LCDSWGPRALGVEDPRAGSCDESPLLTRYLLALRLEIVPEVLWDGWWVKQKRASAASRQLLAAGAALLGGNARSKAKALRR